MAQKQGKLLLVTAGLCLLYNDWLLGPVVNPHMSLRYSSISELGAHMQPYAWLFHTLDISAGVITLLILPRLWQFLHTTNSPWRQVLFATFVCIGADSIIDACLPVACAPSVDVTCNWARTPSLLTHAHMVESTIIGIILFIAPLLWARAFRAKHAALAQICWWFVTLQVTVGASILLTRAMHHDEIVGVFQRCYQLGIGAWVTYILYSALAPQFKTSVATLEPSSNQLSTLAAED